MTDPMQTLKDDIAFMRALAQEGAGAPLLGGSILVAAGLIFAAASVAHWAILTGLLALGPWWFPVVWLSALAVFLAALWILNRRLRGRPGAGSPGNRASGAAWAAVGWTIFAIGAALAIISIRARSETPMLVFPSLILGLYGLGWTTAAAMTGKRWLRATAIGAYGATPLVAWFAIDPAVYLVLLAAVPGCLLMRQAPGKTI